MAKEYGYALTSTYVSSKLLSKICCRLGDAFINMNRLSLLYANSMDCFNLSHKKFLHKFINEEEQQVIIDAAVRRLNKPNPLDSNLRLQFDISHCPPKNTTEWEKWMIKGK